MPDQALPAARPARRIRPATLLWLLAGFGLATMNAPADILATLQHLRVPDPDDAMRLVEVLDLVDGQGWYDLVQHRFGPPGGILSHWSRLVDAPLAGLILLFTPLAGRASAVGIAACLWPTLLFCLYGLVLFRGARATFGGRAAIIALVVATQTVGVTVQFAAGRVDHHGLQLTIVLGLALAIIRGGGRAGLAAGGLAAASLAVGLEGLPSVAAGALFLVGDWVWRGPRASSTLTGFGLGLGITAPVLFAAQTAPVRWGTTACDALSPPWLFLAGAGLVLALGCAALDGRPTRPAARLAAVAGFGALVLAGFAAAFPVCLAGPFTGMSDLVREHWLLKVNEMTSARTFIARGQWEALAFYPVLVAATVVASRFAPRGRAWAVAAVFLWPGLILGLAEFRGLYVASGLVPFVAGAYIDRVLGRGSRRWGEAMVAACLVSTVWIAPAVLGETLLPWTRTAPDPQGATACLGEEALRGLAALPPGTVLAPIFMGPAILLHTPHSVVAAPYHRAVPEIAAAIEGFGGTESDLRRATAARGVAYLVACPTRPADDLQASTAFATRLIRKTAQATWLEALPVPGPLMVWRVAR
ncbi:hypothetical protein [Methylobacterium sp. J-076]|uniref:hypothetical protein n=1 Tax=Methylobacterium sp. J-076 TaxID=2836655 RepID=UPI001FBB02E1|nr:hypothetical protein [Methylobacterium sp. J-076]MCJ2015311.1 hypothetical protein [Methylobacterium sp. J-076]